MHQTMTTLDTQTTLRRELDGAPGSFLLKLRRDREWDKAAFDRLTAVMLAHVEARDPDEPIERWIAEGFWYLDWFVRDWSRHQDFPRRHAEAYYARACGRLHDLAYWLFLGESPYQEGEGFDPLDAADGLLCSPKLL